MDAARIPSARRLYAVAYAGLLALAFGGSCLNPRPDDQPSASDLVLPGDAVGQRDRGASPPMAPPGGNQDLNDSPSPSAGAAQASPAEPAPAPAASPQFDTLQPVDAGAPDAEAVNVGESDASGGAE